MFQPVKEGFGIFLSRFYAGILPTTKPLIEFKARGVPASLLWCPGRMVDQATLMLDAYQKYDPADAATAPTQLPVILVAMDVEYNPVLPEFNYQITEAIPVVMPDDPKQRLFGLRTVTAELHIQVVIVTIDQPTALSLASQLSLFLKHPGNRRFDYAHLFAGVTEAWPVQIEDGAIPLQKVEHDYKNINILAANLVLRATVPLYDAPDLGNPDQADNGVPETPDPAGYQVVVQVDATNVDVP